MPDPGPSTADLVAKSTVMRDTAYGIVLLVALTVAGCVALVVLRPGAGDNVVIITTLIGFASASSILLVTLSKGQEATHQLVNSNMVAFRTMIREEAETAIVNARLAGQKAGRIEGRDIANDRADSLQLARDRRADVVQLAQETRADKLAARDQADGHPAAPVAEKILTVVEDTSVDVKGLAAASAGHTAD